MRTTLIIGTVCLVLGLALGWLAGRMNQSEPKHGESQTSQIEQPQNREAARPEPKLQRPSDPVPAKPLADEKPEPGKTAQPQPDAELAGIVVYDDGTPCSGLKVRALPDMLDDVPPYVQDTWDIERRAAYAAEQVRERYEGVAEATTGADGTFSFAVRDATSYMIRSMNPEVLLLFMGNNYSYVRAPKTDLKLTALALVPVTVDVKFEDGTTPAAVNLTLTRNGQPFQFARMPWTPENRLFPMPVGKLVVKANQSNVTGIEGNTALELSAADAKPSVAIVLKRPQGLTVITKFPSPYYSDIRLVLVPEEKVRNDSFGFMEASMVGIPAQAISADKYFFKGTNKGSHILFISSRYTGVVLRKTLNLEGGSEELIVELSALDRTEHIVVRLRSPDGKPVDGATLMMSLIHESLAFGDFQLCARLGNGEYWLRRPEPDLAERGVFAPAEECELSIRAIHERWGTVYRRIPFSGVTDVEIQFVALTNVRVKVGNLPKTGLSEFTLSIIPEGANPSREMGIAQFLEREPYQPGQPTTPPLAETMNFRSVPVGRARLTLFKRFGSSVSDGVLLVSRDVTLAGPECEEGIDIPELYDLVVIPDQPLGRSELSFRIGNAVGTLLKQDDGSCVARQLPAGECLVRAGTRGFMRVTLPSGGPVNLAPKPGNAYTLARYDSAGVYYRTGLRVGDVIISINGQSVEGQAALRDLREKSATGAAISVEVLRGSRVVQVTLTGDQWKQPWLNGEGLSVTRVD